MEERILVYRDEAQYSNLSSYYKSWTKNLQTLVSGLCKLKIEASMENVKKLLAGEDLRSLMEDSNVSKHLSFLPQKMLKHIQTSVDKENEEEYMQNVGNYAIRFIHLNKSSDWGMLNLNHFVIEGNTVKISKECEDYIDKICCVYIDTPNRKVVYDAYLKFMDAYNELKKAIKEAPKKPNPSNTGALTFVDYNNLRALGDYGTQSLVVLNGGDLDLVGYYFKTIL